MKHGWKQNILITAWALAQTSCAVFGGATQEPSRPIENPFGDLYSMADPTKGLIVRTKRGENSVEVEMPGNPADRTDLIMPLNPSYTGQNTMAPLPDYAQTRPSMTDREIASLFPKGSVEDQAKRSDVEKQLGLMESGEAVPHQDTSYLARIDYVKRLYKEGRYEAGLLEIDQLLRSYPTDPKLYAMRGTLLDRLNYTELAVKNWNESLSLDPTNYSLKKLVEMRTRSIQIKRATTQ
jgi:hypothetical protein